MKLILKIISVIIYVFVTIFNGIKQDIQTIFKQYGTIN